jgi:hypothetical protein
MKKIAINKLYQINISFTGWKIHEPTLSLTKLLEENFVESWNYTGACFIYKGDIVFLAEMERRRFSYFYGVWIKLLHPTHGPCVAFVSDKQIDISSANTGINAALTDME